VKLTDFGIARAEADASLTQTGLVTGSPAYLAPEVASGASATEASDVWSLGATLFHLLAGHPPYDVNENLMGALYKIVHEEPPRLPDAGWLAPVLEHTMTHEPQDRWSMAQVRDFLAQGEDDVTIHPEPLGALAHDDTRVLQATPSAPVAVPPVRPDQPLVGAPTSVARRRGRSPWPWVTAAAVLVAVGVIVAAALAGMDNGAGPTTTHSSTHSPAVSPSGHTSTTPAAADPATAMRSFIANYLATVTSDQHASWAMLTPAFQRVSGGFGQYQGFWRTISSATPRDIQADPAGMTVSYGVYYVHTDGESSSDHVTLHLVRRGDRYLINGES
jgi:serine/threonine protein kinase